MRLGFIGGSGHHYLGGLLKERPEEIEAVAVAGDGHDDAAARRRHEALAGQRAVEWYDSPAALLERFRPDLVNVGAVYAHNGEVAAQVLERGIPCVTDKPAAASWEALAALRAATERTAAPLLTEFDARCLPAIRAARQAVCRGQVGRVVMVSAQKSYRFGDWRPAWYAHRRDYGGTVLWVAAHAIDFVWFTTGLGFRKVFGMSTNVSREDFGTMEEAVSLSFELERDALAVVHADYDRPKAAATHGDDRLRIAGSAGVVEVRGGRCLLTTHDQAETDITDTVPPIPSAAAALLAAVRGEDHELFSTAASLYMAEVLLHARDAADQQRVVKIDAEAPAPG